MQAPMSPKFRKHLSDPRNASKLTESVILNEKSSGKFSVEINNRAVMMRQLGITKK
jgi:hypothetical protein